MSIRVANDYLPTIINSRPLLSRLGTELISLQQDLKSAWPEFKSHPTQTTWRLVRQLPVHGRALIAPNVIVAIAMMVCLVTIALLIDRQVHKDPRTIAPGNIVSEVTILDLNRIDTKSEDNSIGRDGKGRVGFNKGSGEGSGPVRQPARGGGGGGDHQALPTQVGKLPPPSPILASIPNLPPVHPPTLPVAGMDIDPMLWKDMNVPVFGDPRSNSTASSKGPGDGGGMGTNQGLGVGEGRGPGFGPGNDGNTGNDKKRIGCCGESGGHDDSTWSNRILQGKEVEQRAKLLAKPEPQYTEEARRNQITGTVMLRVVFSSSGQVEQIRAIQTLPYGLTEKAIAAARQIRFLPATIGGRTVSVYMQLEYNFNLY